MKEIEERDILAENMEAFELLKRSGCDNVKAKLLIYFLNKKQGKSRDIERAMNMRQPEVSIGIKKFPKREVTGKIVPRKHKGRPEILYTASSKLLDIFIEDVTREYSKMKENLAELKALTRRYK